MRRALRRATGSMLFGAVVVGLLGLAALVPGRALAADPPQQVAAVQQLQSQARAEALAGHFDQTDQILGKAASISHDPTIARLASYSSSFKAQLVAFAAERYKQYDELVKQATLLIKNDKSDYALDIVSRAYSLCETKENTVAGPHATRDEFRKEPWVDQLISTSVKRAGQYEEAGQWLKCMRLYSDLSIVEPSVPAWKDKLKIATRHVRLLAMYTPDSLKAVQEAESGEREAVEQILKPTTRPAATQPAKQDANDKAVNDSFKVDWHETLRGVKPEMLTEALMDADNNYYRGITYKDMALGGFNGLQAVVSTKGLEKAFPGLGDADRRAEFSRAIARAIEMNQRTIPATEQATLRMTLQNVRRANRDTVQIPDEVITSEFADGAFEKLDPFTSMIWPSDLEEFNKATQGKFSGVGVQIQTDDDGSLRVVTPLEDTPAYKAGIKAGDVITHIDGKSAKHITVNQAVRTITGPPDTTVKLTVKSPDGKSKDYTLKRETIHVASVKGYSHKPGGGWDYMVDPVNKIGYIRITNFTADTSAELNSAIDTMKLQKVKGLIMDLRYNPGGLLTAATDVADKFLDRGVIVSTRPDRDTGNQPTAAMAKPDPDDCDLPLVVLVNQYSASASEIVSGALKENNQGDHQRAIIVGERTFGKGSVQMLFPLADRSAYLKLTTSHYYLPLGKCIHREENSKEWGVEPNVTVTMTPDQMRAAIDAREELDVLRDASPGAGEQPKLQQKADAAEVKPEGTPKKGLLASDPQMSAALLLLRLQLADAGVAQG
jgi:carboxyl-terminal processing protease